MTIRWTAFPLHPETPPEGRTLEDLFAGRGMDLSGMLAHLNATADRLGLPFGERHMTFNSRRAQELGKWAEAQGRGDIFHHLTFEAYFVHGRNIAVTDVLLDIAVAAGLQRGEAEDALRARPFRQAVDNDWQRVQRMGVRAVPTFHMHGQMLVGAQPYGALETMMRELGVPARTEA